MSTKPAWGVEGLGWPNREASRFITAGKLHWHVQEAGAGPTLLLLHGSGAATHSWRDLLPQLARDFHVIAPDLPGFGFTETPAGVPLSLAAMTERIAALLGKLQARPDLVVGHSAGAALAIRMVLDGAIEPAAIVAVNGALTPYPGSNAPLFKLVGRALMTNPITALVFSRQARAPGRIGRLIGNTGSRLDPEGLELYGRLFRTPGHVASTLSQMANWDLESLQAEFPKLRTPLTLVVGAGDTAVPPSVAEDVRGLLPQAEIVTLPGLGHLAHEERPDLVAGIIGRVARERGLLPAAPP